MKSRRNNKIVTQDLLNVIWKQVELGNSDHVTLAKLTGLHVSTVKDVIRTNRRIGLNCRPERRDDANAKLNKLMDQGMYLQDAAQAAGLSLADATAERRGHMARNRPTNATLKPRHVTAPEFSEEWYDQQDREFVRVMLREHPEHFRELT